LPQLQGQEADGEGVTENATTETAGDEHVEELLPASLAHPGMWPHEHNGWHLSIQPNNRGYSQRGQLLFHTALIAMNDHGHL
jgi:hypothetical protein